MSIIQVRTLREFMESDQVIDCDCSNYWVCSHTGPLKLDVAVQRLGWEFDFYTGREVLARVVYCSAVDSFPQSRVNTLGWRCPEVKSAVIYGPKQFVG